MKYTVKGFFKRKLGYKEVERIYELAFSHPNNIRVKIPKGIPNNVATFTTGEYIL